MQLAPMITTSNIGYRLHFLPNIQSGKNKKIGEKRDTIKSFSAASVRRLRDTLLFSELKYTLYDKIGITFTLPWRNLEGNILEDYRKVWHRFRTLYVRSFPSSALVFRHELQQRTAPHCHAVQYLAASDKNQKSIHYYWQRALKGFHRSADWVGFVKYGVKCTALDDGFSAFRYLCDHTSKSKQAQLGYKGKQWGILNRDNLKSDKGKHIFRTQKEVIQFARILSRVSRFRISRLRSGDTMPCIFGSKLSPKRRTVAIFASPQILTQFNEYNRLTKSIYPIKSLPR